MLRDFGSMRRYRAEGGGSGTGRARVATGAVPAAGRGRALPAPAVYAATVFLSASLLFFVQPMFAKMVLPHLGGATAVWTTAMLFFQTALLAGYAYAHLISTRLAIRRQVAVHATLVLAGLAFLPLAVPAGWHYDPAAHPAFQTLAVLALGVGVPFMALAANAPLMQKWYARTGAPDAADPYHLYAASNAGSLIALLGYPLVAEPLIGTRQLALNWSAGYVLLGAGLALCALMAARAGAAAPAGPAAAPAARPPAGQVGRWLALAFVPSSTMLGVTAVISTDLGAFPLVWVIPLALYLLTFILAFSPRLRLPRRLAEGGFMASVPAVVGLLALDQLAALGWAGFALLFCALFFIALTCHRRLYESRPPESALTWFYFAMAAGGALGGLFNALIAPVLFDRMVEAHMVFALAGLALAGGGRGRLANGVAFLLATMLGTAAIVAITAGLVPSGTTGGLVLAAVVAAMVIVVGWRRPAGFAIAAGLFLTAGFTVGIDDGVVHRERSFFGVYTVRDDAAEGTRALISGTTEHGLQFLDDLGRRPRVLSYYHPEAPLGQLFRSGAVGGDARVGIVGLGVGALACYAGPGQEWRFYEIDPAVDRIARDPALFDYMARCAGDAPTVLGDARIRLAHEAPVPFDVLVIDAFTSDAIPVHLITLEALALYRARLAPDGLLALHISNRYYDLAPLLANAADRLGMHAVEQLARATTETEIATGRTSSRVVLMARRASALAPFAADPAWRPLAGDGGAVWTDDQANILDAL